MTILCKRQPRQGQILARCTHSTIIFGPVSPDECAATGSSNLQLTGEGAACRFGNADLLDDIVGECCISPARMNLHLMLLANLLLAFWPMKQSCLHTSGVMLILAGVTMCNS